MIVDTNYLIALRDGDSGAKTKATELRYGEPVVTDDNDFGSVDGLRVESY